MKGKYIYGEPGENMPGQNERLPFFQQPDGYSCGLYSQKIILRDFGIDIPFEELEKMAVKEGIYHMGVGTYRDELGKALEMMGIGVHIVPHGSIETLMEEFVKGHRVIVSIDSDELWHNSSFMEKLANKTADFLSPEQGNHALIAAGLEVNPNNPSDTYVVLTDSGSGEFRVKYPLEQFADAWRDSHCYMVATNDPAPYQFDSELGKMVPSNFSINKHLEEYISNNSFALKPDQLSLPEGYTPAFNNEYDFIHQYAVKLDIENNPYFKDFILRKESLRDGINVNAKDDRTLEEKQDNHHVIDKVSNCDEHFEHEIRAETSDEECSFEDDYNYSNHEHVDSEDVDNSSVDTHEDSVGLEDDLNSEDGLNMVDGL